jgi:hypothetical protein
MNMNKQKEQTLWFESASELYRPSDRRLSAKLLPTFGDRGCHVVSVTDPYGRILGFQDRNIQHEVSIIFLTFSIFLPETGSVFKKLLRGHVL